MYIKKTKFLVLGMSKSGRAACKLLLKRGAKTWICDEKPSAAVVKAMKELEAEGAVIVSKENAKDIVNVVDAVVLSPGVPIDNELPAYAAEIGKSVIGELELAYSIGRCPIVAVTGTNGKTTTCSLIYDILKKSGEDCCLAGNVGTPYSSVVDNCTEDTFAVLEVSSFQLETTSKFSPYIACVLNVTPDHLNRHYNMENYVYLKSKLLSELRESEYAVLSADDETVARMGQNCKAKKVFFSVEKQTNGAYIQNGVIFWRGKEVLPVSELKLSGLHNVENALAAVCVAGILDIDIEKLAMSLKEFSGVKHRQEIIAEKDGVIYIDDSKATNPDSSLKAVEACGKSIILLVGGIDKGFGYNTFFAKIAESGKLRAVVIYGRSRRELYRCAENAGIENLYLSVGFVSAVGTALSVACHGDTVLLSPACASFDEFSGFEERGDAFVGLVNEYISRKKEYAVNEGAENCIIDNVGVVNDCSTAVTAIVQENCEKSGDVDFCFGCERVKRNDGDSDEE